MISHILIILCLTVILVSGQFDFNYNTGASRVTFTKFGQRNKDSVSIQGDRTSKNIPVSFSEASNAVSDNYLSPSTFKQLPTYTKASNIPVYYSKNVPVTYSRIQPGNPTETNNVQTSQTKTDSPKTPASSSSIVPESSSESKNIQTSSSTQAPTNEESSNSPVSSSINASKIISVTPASSFKPPPTTNQPFKTPVRSLNIDPETISKINNFKASRSKPPPTTTRPPSSRNILDFLNSRNDPETPNPTRNKPTSPSTTTRSPSSRNILDLLTQRNALTNNIPTSALAPPTSDLLLRLKAVFYNTASNSGNDALSQTKARVEGLIDILKVLSDNPSAVEFVKNNLGGSPCINSLDDAIAATQTLLDLVERSDPEITNIVNTFTNLKNEKDTVALMRGTVKLLNDLDTLIPKWAKFPLTSKCRVSDDESIEGMQQLVNLIYRMSKNPDYSLEVRDYLKRSGNNLDAVTTFLANFRKIIKKFPEFCSSDPFYTDNAIESIGELIDEASILLKSLGRSFDLREIKQTNIRYATQLLANIKKLEELELGLFECDNQFLSLRLAAETLSDLTDIVEEIGIETLSQELGINFSLAF